MSDQTNEKIYLEENGCKVTNSRVVLGSKNFVLRNIASVECYTDNARNVFLVVAILFVLAGTFLAVSGSTTPGLLIILFSLIFFLFPQHYYVKISTGGPAQMTNAHKSREFTERVVAAINDALLDLDRKEQTQNSPPIPQASDSGSDLKKFKQMLDDGLITQEDYDAKKKQILGL